MSAPVHKAAARFVEWIDMNGEDLARGAVAQPRPACWGVLDPLAVCHRLSARVRPAWEGGVPLSPRTGRPNARLLDVPLIPRPKRKTLPLLWHRKTE